MPLCVLRSKPHKLSAKSVMFDFNASLNDVAPLSSMQLTVDVKRRE